MAAKSILEVEVATAEFARFKALFDQYQEQLKKQPALWATIAKSHKAMETQLQHAGEAAGDEHKKLQDVNKVSEENERRLNKSTNLWQDMAKSSENFAKNLTSASGFLSKWGGLLFSGVIGGAMFGVDRAVHDASANRQQAMGLGVSIGELKAFGANFARIGDTNGMLSSVGAMETDVTQRKPWYALGLGKMTGDTVKDTMALLDAERKFAQNTPTGLIGPMAQAYGLPSSTEQLRLMGATGDKEWNGMKQGTMSDIGRMNLPGAQSLQDLETQFKRNMSTIGTAFETQLGRAAPALSTFSDVVTRSTEKFINKTGDEAAGLWNKAQTDPFGAYKDAVFAPFKAFGGLAQQSWDAYGNLIGSPLADKLLGASNWLAFTADSVTANSDSYKAYLGRRDMVSGLPKGLLEAVFQTESSGQMYPANSKAGAMGPFQFMQPTADMLGINPHDPAQSAAGAEKYLLKLMNEFHDLDKALAAYNWGPGKVEADVKAHGKDWMRFAPKETQDYVRKIEVIVHQQPGVDVTVASNQLAH